jgi:hypothetical protein
MKKECIKADFMKQFRKKLAFDRLSVYSCTLKTSLLWKA